MSETKQALSTEELTQQLAQEAYIKQQSTYKFPTEMVTLPSKGLLYDKDSLLANGEIEMKYMSAKEEDILTSKSLIQNKTVLDKLYKSLIITPIKYEDLLLGDKNKIMVAARILGYGKDYKVEKFKCPECGYEHTLNVNLNELTEKEINENDLIEKYKNEFIFKLPVSKRTIKFKLLTQNDYNKIQIEIKSLQKFITKSGVSPDVTLNLKHAILELDGNTDRKEIIKFVDNELLASDSRALREEMKRVSPTVNMTYNFICENSMECNFSDEIDFPVDVDFFWPKA